ncbi:MBL fold metallo-hydrolase [Robertkochia solimangrovi]|uniref:MBL fold metallo-hydrolase n=1 Tax=Robertkochia solimangrovi TaxID=2213046 RepID=UPI001180AC5D|nr:MBL fold metallo-hydrolase [Robertkochia solimangrovi]TRZ45394.1 MBL fold metallo-hydrolase [Robertkochia solimangrovi]
MKIILHLSLLLICIGLKAQIAEGDKIGDLHIQPVYHGSLALEYSGKSIYIDPYGGAALYESLPSPDIILITDIHGDHYDTATLEAIDPENSLIIAPKAVYDKMNDTMKEQTVVLNNGDSKDAEGITIKAIPMYNLPEADDAPHVKGRGNGYVLTLGKTTVYISGDTEGIPEMRNLKGIDIAFVCMNLPYTMDVDQAADAVLEFKPGIVYPYHYRGRPDMSDVATFKKIVNDNDPNIEVRLKDWYPKS